MRLAIAAILTLLLLCSIVPAPAPASNPTAPGWNNALWATPPTANWMSVGGSIQQQHYSALTGVNKGNVANLSQAWMTHLDGSCVRSFCSAEATPLVFDGVMYVVTGDDDVFALDATNGTHLWTHLAHLPNLTSVCCGWDARGLAMGEGKIFVAQLDGNVVALDQSTGNIVWKTPNLRWQDGTGMTAAPLYYKGLVYVGSTGGEFGYRGSITAYNAATGNRVWRFYTVPEPGDYGSWSWPNDETWKVGGATVWGAPSIDPATGILYLSTGNASPTGDRLPGDDLFSSSIIALDAMTGTYKWHFQMVHHDQWDFDCPSPPVVFEANMGAAMRPAIAEACKTGWVYELQRTDGLPLIPGNIVEQPVEQSPNKHTALTQPIVMGDAMVPHCANPADFPALAPDGKPFKFGCIFGAYDASQFVAQAPGGPGGNNWAPMSFNPQTNMLYTCAIVTAAAKEAVNQAFVPGQHYNPARTVNGAWPFKYGYGGTLSAYNVATNKIAWQIKTPPGEPCYGGSLSTAGGVVFWGRNTGVMEADDAATGTPLWHSPQLLSGADAPPMSYSVRGKQYVAIFAGGSWFTNDRGAKNPHGDTVYAFALK